MVNAADVEARKRQIEEERKEGWTVDEVLLRVGESKTIQLPFAAGPIILTRPDVIRYTRKVVGSTPAKTLPVVGVRSGFTDLIVQDPSSEKRTAYFVTVINR